METNESPVVFCVLLNWNGYEDTLACLDSLAQIDYPEFHVVVVDNASVDNSTVILKDQRPNVTIIQNDRNLGYAGGNNVGIRYALEHGAEYVLILNNDTVVDKGIIKAFLGVTTQYPDAGLFSAKVYYRDQPSLIQYAGARWSQERYDYEFRGHGQQDDGSFDELMDAGMAFGCAFLADTRVLRHVGLFDDGFFLNYEDADLSARATRAGFRCIYVPSAVVWHKVSASIGGIQSPLYQYFMTRNHLLWAKKNLDLSSLLHLLMLNTGRLWTRVFPRLQIDATPLALKAFYWQCLGYARLVRRQWRDPTTVAIVAGLRDFLLGRFGDCPPQIRELNRLHRMRRV